MTPASPIVPAGAIVLAGGRGRRLGGVDKAALRVGGGTLLDRALAAVAGCDPVVVVGPPGVTAGRPGPRRVQEEPAYAGPAAGLLTGLAALTGPAGPPAYVVGLAVDLPGVTADTVARLLAAARVDDDVAGAGPVRPDGAVLVDAGGRRQPCLVVAAARLAAAAPDRAAWPGLSLRGLLAPLSLAEMPATGVEADDVDTPDDLRRITRFTW